MAGLYEVEIEPQVRSWLASRPDRDFGRVGLPGRPARRAGPPDAERSRCQPPGALRPRSAGRIPREPGPLVTLPASASPSYSARRHSAMTRTAGVRRRP